MPSKPKLAAILLTIAAVAAILLPFLSATLLTVGLGGIAFAAGIGQFLRLSGPEAASAKLFRALSGLLYCAAAVWVLVDPIDSEISLTLFAGVLMLVNGVMELAAGASAGGQSGGFVLVDGLITSLLGLFLVLEWPSDSLWALGTLFGVGLFMTALNLFRAEQSAPPAG
ncbi:MAG: hypothetical protein CBD47_08705 [Synechococcus sp. TMED187]|jgi:uncharacterized membrane protein HdeD (DUF308 family)|uniref:HdeD family acid-resistance protein n=1 Tax=Synechococcus sp. UW105 TaxID=337067 RepID=UPI000B683B6F|nr:DUF308 domain-containing protein [Synechococcus sp. UW105]MAS26968.1 hypothetical protein [Synechococcus sp. NAT40]OUW45445.1 MAG: hypothetical protein CBD47_08705 [Synechococcus sp. TMED187]RZO14503.1 MAG: hypothetical protein EVB08_02925 [Synechococcus sp. MED-G135]|tara:strand:+ start:60 stop:566 length:507 start_codon:yes stop_codon:yes gene_type:complete